MKKLGSNTGKIARMGAADPLDLSRIWSNSVLSWAFISGRETPSLEGEHGSMPLSSGALSRSSRKKLRTFNGPGWLIIDTILMVCRLAETTEETDLAKGFEGTPSGNGICFNRMAYLRRGGLIRETKRNRVVPIVERRSQISSTSSGNARKCKKGQERDCRT